jgi:membrane protease YdiL (CAAX protease family)
MTTRTLCLSLMIFAATISPVEVLRGVAAASGRPTDPVGRDRQAKMLAYELPVVYVLVVLLVLSVIPERPFLLAPTGLWWYGIAVLAAPLALGTEILVAYLWIRVRRLGAGRIVLHDAWSGAALPLLITTVVVGGCEEVLFRGVWLRVLVGSFGWAPALGVVVTATVYALSHKYFGAVTVAQKWISGLLYGSLFVASGQALAIPLVVHTLQNALTVAVGGARRR